MKGNNSFLSIFDIFICSCAFMVTGCTYFSADDDIAVVADTDIKWEIEGKYPCIHLQNYWSWDSLDYLIDTVAMFTDTLYAVALSGDGEVHFTLNDISIIGTAQADDSYYFFYLNDLYHAQFFAPDSIRFYYQPGIANWMDCYVGNGE